MFHINTDADNRLQTASLPEDSSAMITPAIVSINSESDIESGLVTEPVLYTLSAKKAPLYLFPTLDSGVKALTIVTDLRSTNTSPALTTIAGVTQFFHSTGLNVKSTAENCVATANMVRFGVYPEEWPVLSRCKRTIAILAAFPPTIAATISDASQTFFLVRMVGSYRYLKRFPSIAWDLIGGSLAIATGWTTLFTKGLETGHAVSSILGTGEQHPNRMIHIGIVGFSWGCSASALVHETALTFTAMSLVCLSVSIPIEEAKYPLLAVSFSNGVATACYQKAFMVNALQKSYRCIAENNFTRKTALILTCSLGLSLLTLLEMQFNKITYRSTLNSFDMPDDESTDFWIKMVAGYVFASMYVVGATALFDPVSQITNWVGIKIAGGYQLVSSVCNYIGDKFWQALVPDNAREHEASLSLLADTDTFSDDEEEDEISPKGINHSSIQAAKKEEPSPYIAQNLFAVPPAEKMEKLPKPASRNVMPCGLF